MAVKFTNNAKTTLAANLTSSATSATVTDGSVFPTLSAGEYFYCTFDDGSNNEIVKVTARSGNTLTIVRAADNTTAKSFTSGDAAELRATAGLLTDIQENIAAKSANQTVYNTTTASSATDYDIGIDPSVEANAMVFLNGVMQHHDTFSFSGSTLTFDTAPPDGMALEVIVDNLINLQSSNLTVDTFTAADVGGNPQTDFTLSDAPAAEDNLLVFIDGVFQDQDAYTISNQTLTITDGVTADFGVTVYVINPVNIGTPSDGTVTSSKLSGNITMPADLTVTGDVAFDSPTFVVDNANSRVGIGTASPSTLLDIVGDVKMSANLTVDTSTLHVDATNNRVGIGVTSPTGKLGIYGGNIDDIPLVITHAWGSSSTALISASNASSEVFKVERSGKVGIGTTSPAGSGLHIKKDTSATTNELLRLSNSAGSTTDGVKIVMEVANTSGNGGEIGVVRDGGSFNPYMFFSTSSGVGSSPTEAMRITSSGNVGIGGSTITDSNLLNLQGSGASKNIGIVFNDTNTSKIFSIQNGGSALKFFDYTASTERMRIDTSGRLLVNLTSNDNGAFIQTKDAGSGCYGWTEGTSAVDARIFANTSQGAVIATQSAHPLALQTNGSEKMRIQSNGEVEISGIGNTSGARLNIGSDANNAFVRSYDTAAGIVIGTTNAHPVKFMSNSSERMRIDSSGDVLIGQTSQTGYAFAQKLVVGDGDANDGITIQSGSTHQGNLAFNHSDGTTAHGRISYQHNTNYMSFFTNNTERMRINSSGEVGINNGRADAHLNVRGPDNSGYGIQAEQHGASGTPYSAYLYNANTKVFDFRWYGTTIGHISNANGTSISYNTTSDYRLKENVVEMTGALDRVNQLQPKRFNFIADETNRLVDGFLAHEVQDIVPEAVTGEKDAVKEEEYEITPAVLDDDGNVVTEAEMGTREVPEYQGIDQSKLVPLLTKAIQEQQEQIETLKQEIREIREGG